MTRLKHQRIGDKRGYTIMFVDDDIEALSSVINLVQNRGFRTLAYRVPEEALEAMHHENFDLLVVDFLMPGMSGEELIGKLREFNKEVYVLLLTGHARMAPGLEMIRKLDIQAYCEKGPYPDQFILLLESGIKSVAMMRTIRQFRDGLNQILSAVPKIYQLKPAADIMEEILQGLLSLVDSEDAFLLIDNISMFEEPSGESNSNRSMFNGMGKYNVDFQKFMAMLDSTFMEQMGHARTTRETTPTAEGMLFPMVSEYNQTMGVLYIESNNITDWVRLLEIYAGQAGSSLSNAFLHSLVNIKNEKLEQTYAELKKRYQDTIEVLRRSVDAKHSYTRCHSDRVAFYAAKIGESFNLSADEREVLRIGGLFHDVGKIGTSDDILTKEEKLSSLEYEEIKKHPLKGANILSAIAAFKDAVPLVRCHHERMDGNGYPQGLKGEQIPFLARILAVADAFDAMTTERQYREKKLDIEAAVNELTRGRGTQFDSDIVDHFLEILKNFDEIVKELPSNE